MRGVKFLYSTGSVGSSFSGVDFLPQILSTEDKPKQPKARSATASTKGVDGAILSSVKLFS